MYGFSYFIAQVSAEVSQRQFNLGITDSCSPCPIELQAMLSDRKPIVLKMRLITYRQRLLS